MYVRWLGAFRKNGSLSEAIRFEMTRTTNVACEHFKKKSRVRKARVGLLVDPTAVYKNFKGDVWSEYDPNGNLYYTQKPYEACSDHTESWAKPVYTGLVIKNGSFENLSPKARDEIRLAVFSFKIGRAHV